MYPGDTPRVLALYDGAEPPASLAFECERLGMAVMPYVERMPLAPVPRLLMGPATEWRLQLGLSPQFSGLIELGERVIGGWAEECVEAAAAGGMVLAMTTRSAFGSDIPRPFAAAIAARFPAAEACVPAMELALYEAVANALVHGNLGLESDLRGSAEELKRYRASLAERMADPMRATRLVILTFTPFAAGFRLVVRDQGDGWDVDRQLAKSAAAEAKSGRGLGLIRQIAAGVTARDGGRALVMDFRAEP